MEGVPILNLTINSNDKILLIHKNMEAVMLNHTIDIILTPQFYTFLREVLEVRFVYQAKQIAASLFDDYLDPKIEHQYHVYKCNDEWCFFAYNIQEITDFLQTKGIEKNKIGKIYFAQQISKELENPLWLNNQEILYTVDGTATVIPRRFINNDTEYQPLNLKALSLKGGISMGNSFNSFISLKHTIILTVLLFILGSVFVVESNRIKSSLIHDEEKLTKLLDNNPRLTSSMIRESVLNKYQPIDTQERNKRESIKEISKLLSVNSELQSLSIDDNLIKATVITKDRIVNQQVKERATIKQFTIQKNAGFDVIMEKKL